MGFSICDFLDKMWIFAPECSPKSQEMNLYVGTLHKFYSNSLQDIDWVQTEKHVFETASNHPFLVGLHSCFQTPSRLFFVIEFVRGGDLMFHMQRQRRLPEEHARFYSAEICLALNFLHTRGTWVGLSLDF